MLSTKSNVPSDIEVLSSLPREVRDRVYDYYFAKKYLVCGTKFWDKPSHYPYVAFSNHGSRCSSEVKEYPTSEKDPSENKEYGERPKVEDADQSQGIPLHSDAVTTGAAAGIEHSPMHLSLLRVCKRMNNESVQMLYSKRTFRFAFDLTWRVGQPIAQAIAERLMHVEVDIDMSEVGFQIDAFHMDVVAASAIRLFSNSPILRKSIRIQLWSCSDRCLENFLIGLLRVLKGLIGFAKVTIEIESVFKGKEELVEVCYAADSEEMIVYEREAPREISPNVMEYQYSVWFPEQESQQAAAWLEMLRNALETTLGPGTSGDERGAHNVVFARYLEFLPQQHQSALQRSKAHEPSNSVEAFSLAE